MDSYNMYLYNERMSLGLSMRQFAKKIGVSLFKYHLIENGYLRPNKKDTAKISAALNIDYAPYTEGPYSYPAEKEYKRKHFVKLYNFIGSLFFKIFTAFMSVLCIAVCILSITLYASATTNKRLFYSDTYLSFHDVFVEKSNVSFSVTSSMMRPEIYKVEANKYISLKGEYDDNEVGTLNFKTVYWADDYRCVLSAVWVDFNHYYYMATITEYETNEDLLLGIDDNNGVYEVDFQETKYEDILKQYAAVYFDDYDALIAEKLSLNVSSKEIYDDSQSTLTTISGAAFVGQIGYIFTALVGLIMLFGLFFSFVYGTKHGVEKKLNHGLILRHAGITLPKTDLRFMPVIPETVFEIIGIVLVAIASLRIQIYIGLIASSTGLGLSLADVRHLYDPFMMCFYTGMFLLYFIDFDLFMEDKRVIRNVVLYLFVFIGVYVLEVSLLETINNQTLFFTVIKDRLPNMFGTISMYFLIMYFLYFTPKFVNTKKKVIVFRLLSLIPLLIIIFTYIIFHGANTSFGWNLPNWAYYLFASERITFSLLCVSYLYGVYFLRLYFKYKYGDEMATNYFNGNRFLFAKNTLICTIIIIIAVIDLIIARIPGSKSWGFGYTYYTLLLIPLLFFYHPHKGPRRKIVDYITLALYILAFSGVLSFFVSII